MNPSGMPPTAFTRRSLMFNLILLLCLIAVFAWFQLMNLQNVRYLEMEDKGVLALSKRDTAHARERFDAFLRAYPNNYPAYVKVSSDCLALDQPTLALEYIQRGLEAARNASKPERALLYLQLADVLTHTDPARPQTKAIEAARTALSLTPDDFRTKNAVGYMLADNEQNLDEAEKLLRQALASLPEAPREDTPDSDRSMVEDSFGWLLFKKGDYPGAVAALNEAIHDLPVGTPGYAAKYYYYHLAAAYRKAGKIDDARRTLAITLQYDPAFAEAKTEETLLPPINTPPAPSPSTAPSSSTTHP